MKYIVKQHGGKWAIFSRTGNKKNKANDKLVEIVPWGLHTALSMANTMTTMAAASSH